MTKPLVSIVIPCYNAERYLRESVDSALRQTYEPVEIIVIDDGSTDSSPEILRSYGNAIRWERQPNRGGCAARNRGVEISQGEFIQFLDADDFLYENKLAKQAPLALDHPDTLVFCDAETIGPRHAHHVRTDSTEDPVIFMLRGGIQTSAALHRKSWLTTVKGFREDLPCAQEHDLQLRIACQGVRFQRLPEKLYAVRWVSNSVSSNLSRVLDQFERILPVALEDLRTRDELNERRKHEFAGAMARAARAYVRLGERAKAAKYFAIARQMHESGGIDLVFGPLLRATYGLLGPEVAEWVSQFKRGLTGAKATT